MGLLYCPGFCAKMWFETIGVLVVDHLLDRCDIMIADSVRDEVAIAGRRYPDAQAARQRINQGRISTLTAGNDHYQRYRQGEISFGRLAEELGVTTWELSHILEDHGWPAYNLPAAP